MTEPTTQTGKALADFLHEYLTVDGTSPGREAVDAKVAAVEREAAASERARLMGLLTLSDEDPDHAPGPGYLSDRRALFLSGWHERAQEFRKTIELADRADRDA